MMTREIKFRVADTRVGEVRYYYFTLQEVAGLDDTWFDEDGFVWQQYTGLKDNNGVEIYEGDVVRYCSDYGWYIGEVAFGVSDSMNDYEMCDVLRGYYLRNHVELSGEGLEDEDGDFEIIGNIYENPEILETLRRLG